MIGVGARRDDGDDLAVAGALRLGDRLGDQLMVLGRECRITIPPTPRRRRTSRRRR